MCLTVYRYCAAVDAAAKPGKGGASLLPRVLLSSLEDLLERLTGTPSANPVNSFAGRKPAKPGLDKIGSWIEGRLTKFIAGDEVANSAPANPVAIVPVKNGTQAPVGPFSHFSTISPGASGQISRTTSVADFQAPNGQLVVQPYSRSSSPVVPTPSQWGTDHAPEFSSSSAYHDQYASSSGTGFAPLAPRGVSREIFRDDDEFGVADETSKRQPDLYGDQNDSLKSMAYLSLGSESTGRTDSAYEPTHANGGDDDEDLGFGNTSLSRGRTPRPQGEGSEGTRSSESKPAETQQPRTKDSAANASSGKGW